MTVLAARAPDASDQRLLAAIAADLPGRRWFPAKGTAADLSVHAVLPLADPLGAADVRVLLVAVRSTRGATLLQVPLVVEAADTTGPDVPGVPLGDGRTVLDGAAHPAFLRAWFDHAEGPHGTPAPVDLDRISPVTTEQSNSSVILGAPKQSGGAPARAILKILRTVQPGENPDVDVPRRLVEEGYTSVPAPLAWLRATWPDLAEPQTSVTGYLGVASAFVPDAHDGFALACERAAEGTPFDTEAYRLGAVTARMHIALARAYPTVTDEQGPDRLAAALLERFAWASDAVPELERYRPAVERTAQQVRSLPSTPERQRVHGDLHLGQVLHVGDDWLVLDFEGEPQAPLEARTRPDLAVRDVAGLLRSFDYAAAVGGLTGEAARRWSGTARAALLDGYHQHATPAPPPVHRSSIDPSATDPSATDPAATEASAAEAWTGLSTTTAPDGSSAATSSTSGLSTAGSSGTGTSGTATSGTATSGTGASGTGASGGGDDATQALLTRVLELDKTLYEAVYEARNRPTWLPIPLAGLDRLTADA